MNKDLFSNQSKKNMKKSAFCECCRKNMGYGGHVMLLSLVHLEIEHFPKTNFSEDYLFEKARGLIRSVSEENVHLNLAYASTQLLHLEEKTKTRVA